MTYSRPSLVVLGDARAFVLGKSFHDTADMKRYYH